MIRRIPASTPGRCGAFTLVELLVVLVIVVLLGGLILAAFAPARARARQATCSSNLHQIWSAIGMYRTDYGGTEAVKGQGSDCADLGLPCGSPEPLTSTYLRDRDVLFCPDFQGFYPGYQQQAEQMATTYMWFMPPKDDDVPLQSRFSTRVAAHGDELPIIIDENHNPRFGGDEPRWTRKSVTLVQLNGQVVTKQVPTKLLFSEL